MVSLAGVSGATRMVPVPCESSARSCGGRGEPARPATRSALALNGAPVRRMDCPNTAASAANRRHRRLALERGVAAGRHEEIACKLDPCARDRQGQCKAERHAFGNAIDVELEFEPRATRDEATCRARRAGNILRARLEVELVDAFRDAAGAIVDGTIANGDPADRDRRCSPLHRVARARRRTRPSIARTGGRKRHAVPSAKRSRSRTGSIRVRLRSTSLPTRSGIRASRASTRVARNMSDTAAPTGLARRTSSAIRPGLGSSVRASGTAITTSRPVSRCNSTVIVSRYQPGSMKRAQGRRSHQRDDKPGGEDQCLTQARSSRHRPYRQQERRMPPATH